MNRYPLNSRVIGAGGQSPLSFVAAFETFVLNVSATASAVRGMRAAQTFTLQHAAETVVTRFFSAAQTLSLDLSLTTKSYFMKYAEAAQALLLSTTVTARQRIKRYAQVTQTLALTASFTIHQRIKTYASALQNFSMRTTSKFSRFVHPVIGQPLSAVVAMRARITRHIPIFGTFVLTGLVEIRTAIGTTITQALVLASNIVASDRTTTPANIERTVEIPDISRMVVVPGESYESGV